MRRRLVAPDVVDFVPIDYGHLDDAEAIREHVQKTTPGPFQWDCFTFGAIEHGESTTVYLAVDHLHTDGLGQYLSCFDLAHLYAQQVWSAVEDLPPAASYLDYCIMERQYTAAMTLASHGVRKWLELIRGNDGELPSFPLGLGKRTDGYNRSAHRSITLMDEDDARRFEEICRENDAEFVGGVFAAAALAERELVDSDYYFGMTPISTRTSPAERASVGWYVSLVPVAFPIGTSSFARAVTIAQRAYENGIRLAPTSFHRVLELLPADTDIKAGQGWSTPMISYVDARDFIGHEFFGEVRGGVYANRAASEEVLVWINRLPTGDIVERHLSRYPGGARIGGSLCVRDAGGIRLGRRYYVTNSISPRGSDGIASVGKLNRTSRCGGAASKWAMDDGRRPPITLSKKLFTCAKPGRRWTGQLLRRPAGTSMVVCFATRAASGQCTEKASHRSSDSTAPSLKSSPRSSVRPPMSGMIFDGKGAMPLPNCRCVVSTKCASSRETTVLPERVSAR
ncbi:condensation domain-containing protein [Nocardia vinacea]|uniref:condensation domain-containing protein n=1 Tax=Nocardia vinacea TaxID=96468 RepID=UPI0033D697B2